MSYSLDLHFVDHRKASLPAPPVAQIYIKTSTREEDGTTYITPECMSFGEFNEQIDRLQKELEELRKKAKKKFGS